MQAARLIDNKTVKLHQKFTEYCRESTSLKIATGYFYLSAFNIMYDDIEQIINRHGDNTKPCITIIMGTETDQHTADALHRGYTIKELRDRVKKQIADDMDLSSTAWSKEKLEKIATLIYDNRIQVKIHTRGKFHAKAYLFEGTQPHYSVAIIGSSNFTPPGIGHCSPQDSNVELNIITQDQFYEINSWFKNIFDDSEEFNRDLLNVLKNSKPWINLIKNDSNFVSPTLLYLIMAAEVLKNELPTNYHENDVLTEFQKIGVISADRKIENLSGVIISDAVGLGKTYIAIELMKQSGLENKLLIVPASLKENWTDELLKNGISQHVEILSLQELSRLDNHNIRNYQKYKFIVIDEAHRLRNSDRNNYRKLKEIINVDPDKRIVLLTATPINNSIQDLKNLIQIFVHLPDLLALNPNLNMSAFDEYSKFLNQIHAKQTSPEIDVNKLLETIKQILAEVMVLRTRSNIASRYSSIEIDGVPHKFPPPPRLEPIECSYPPPYIKVHDAITDLFKNLKLPHIGAANPSSPAFIGLYLSHIFKRLESSVHSFICSLNNLRSAESEFKHNIEQFGLKRAAEMQWAEDTNPTRIIIEQLSSEEFDVDDLSNTSSLEDHLIVINKDGHRQTLSKSKVLEAISYDLRRINDFLEQHVPTIKTGNFLYRADPKIKELKSIINAHADEKILIFSQYIDTVEYIYENLKNDFTDVNWIVGTKNLNNQHSRYSRSEKISMFAPIANKHTNAPPIRILIASDTISEGVNLQDCSLVINYDLPWNPTRLIQRLGRVDRIGSSKQTTSINLLPDPVFITTLGLLERIAGKIAIQSAIIGFENPLLTKTDPISHKTIGESPISEIDASFEKLRRSRKYADYELASKNPFLEFAHELDPSRQALDLKRLIHDLGLEQQLQNILDNTSSVPANPYTIINTNGKKKLTFAMYSHKHKTRNNFTLTMLVNHNKEINTTNNFELFDLYKYSSGVSLKNLPSDTINQLSHDWDQIDAKNNEIIMKKNKSYGPGKLDVPPNRLQQLIITAIHEIHSSRSVGIDNTIDLSLAQTLDHWLTTTPIDALHIKKFKDFTNMDISQLVKCDALTVLTKVKLFYEQLCSRYPIYARPIPRGDIQSTLICRGAFI